MAAGRFYSSVAQPSTLVNSINNSVTSIQIAAAVGLPLQYPFTMVIDRGLGTEEIVSVTNVVGSTPATLTVVRGYDGTTASSHAAAAEVRHMATAGDLRAAAEHIGAVLSVHGVTGAVVGTTDTQTLTNKSISGSTNTVTNLPTSALADSAVTAVKLATDAVTQVKVANGAIGTAEVIDANITKAKLATDAQVFLVPTGGIVQFAAAAAPSGFLLCDGSNVSRSTYSGLFAVIGTQFGNGDGSTTFGLPSLKGKVPVGFDAAQTEFDTLGETGGEKTHTLTSAEMPAHTHVQDAHVHAVKGTTMSVGVAWSQTATETGSGSIPNRYVAANGVPDISAQSTTATNQSTGGDGAHNNLQPYIVLNYIIKT